MLFRSGYGRWSFGLIRSGAWTEFRFQGTYTDGKKAARPGTGAYCLSNVSVDSFTPSRFTTRVDLVNISPPSDSVQAVRVTVTW